MESFGTSLENLKIFLKVFRVVVPSSSEVRFRMSCVHLIPMTFYLSGLSGSSGGCGVACHYAVLITTAVLVTINKQQVGKSHMQCM